ncbi:MAG: hypothetical protein S4CHLAM81_01380 [Chlamydiales bacterium]|nr:hypothetical protein [Chlamydiales bacterium]MCH9634934.1 hypothetical protein [Chlamydiales bacterium]MCH9703533.1 hypothetical protein [Chlamydiota bacterium]
MSSEYQEKFALLEPWVEGIIETVKKDLKNEHLKKDRNFCKRYFLGKNFNMVSVEEMAPAYLQEISQGNVGLGEFITSRWLLKNSDVYDFFESELSKVNPDFETIEALDAELSKRLIEGSVKQFGHVRSYLFAVLNSVTFSKDLFDELREKALVEEKRESEELTARLKEESLDSMQKRHERELGSIQNRYDKKFSGLQKKYVKDTENLKKQISALTKKLAEHG